MAAFAKRYTVQGSKVGPDYIDPGYHTAGDQQGAFHKPRYVEVLSKEQVKNIFIGPRKKTQVYVSLKVSWDYSMVMMGLTEQGSTAEVAKLLSTPVIFVIDAGKIARQTAAAIALGFREFDRDLNLAGVIVNNVGSEKHAQWVTEAIESTGIQVMDVCRSLKD